jgi:serine/threonine-protein kinase
LIKLVDFGLVKQMLPDEMTVTVIQGRGTALYTPLEQYGGDSGHTDPRSDLYSLGATLYHLLTNHPPTEAKERFLHPESLIPPRQINSAIDADVEHALLWAMALHPDQRPAEASALRAALLKAPSATMGTLTPEQTWRVLLAKLTPLDRAIGVALGAAFLLGILASLS